MQIDAHAFSQQKERAPVVFPHECFLYVRMDSHSLEEEMGAFLNSNWNTVCFGFISQRASALLFQK